MYEETKAAIEAGIKSLRGEQDKLKSKVEGDIKAVQDQIREIEQKGAPYRSGEGPTTKAGDGLAAISQALRSDEFKSFAAGKSVTSGPMDLGVEIKSLLSLQGNPASAATGVDVQPQYLGLVAPVQRPLRVFEVLPQRQVGGNTVGFNRVKWESDSNAADYQAGEGEDKAEQTLVSEWVEAPIVTIAVHTTLSRQVMADEAGLATEVDRLLRFGLAEKLDRELVNGDGSAFNLSGLLTEATTHVPASGASAADIIGAAASDLAADGYAPGVVFLNPSDWFTIQSERVSGTGEYVAGGWRNVAPPSIYGMRVVQTSSIAAGTALVIDPGVVELCVRQQPTVEMSREHNQNLTKNLVTILAELRIGVLVKDASGMLKMNIAG